MAVLTASKVRPVQLAHGPLAKAELPMEGGIAETIYKGSIVASDASSADGYFRALVSGANQAADVFGGIAAEEQSIAAAQADGDVVVSVYRNGVWGFAVGSIAITDIGAPIYASDDDTATTTSTTNQWIGHLEGIDGTYAWVNIELAFMKIATAFA